MRARIKVLVDKIGMDAFRELVDEELKGDWVDERDFSIDHLVFVHDEEANAPGVPESHGSPNGDKSEFEAWVDANVQPQRQEGFVTATVKVDPRRPHPGAVPRPRPDHARLHRRLRPHHRAAEPRPALGPATSPSTTSGSASRSWTSPRPAPSASPTWSAAPAPTAASSASPASMGLNRGAPEAARGDGDHRSAHQADPHQDERLPQRLLPAPHRHDRLLRRVDQGRRPHDPRLHPPHRRQLRGRRRRLRPSAQGAAAGQARPGCGRALDPPLRGEPERRRELQRLRRPHRLRRASRS